MKQEVVWAQNIGKDDIPLVGGKGANLGEMIQIGLPVPPAFVVSAPAFHEFLRDAGVAAKLFPQLAKLDVEDPKALRDAAEVAKEMVLKAKMPAKLDQQVREAYRSLAKAEGGKEPLVAVRSSATAEDLPEASFAGQQETFLNIRGEDMLLEHVQKCWASLYTPRAIYYRVKHSFPHDKVAIAVVVQIMVDAAKAGVMFTKHPSTGADISVIEAAWGLGEGVVSGHVTPDTYEVGPDGKPVNVRVAQKDTMYVRGKNDRTVVEPVVGAKKTQRVVSDEELKQLHNLGRGIEKHYGTPQDIEWAIDQNGRLNVLQARPITTLKPKGAGQPQGQAQGQAQAQGGGGKSILSGLGASPGIAVGKVALVDDIEHLEKCGVGDILVTQMTTPDMVPAMKRAAAIVTDEGGMTCFAGEVEVVTDRGLVPFEQLYELAAREPLRALSVDPTTLQTEWRPIVRVMAREADTIEVAVSQTGAATPNTLRLTPTHKMLTFEDAALVERPMEHLLARGDMVTTVDQVPATQTGSAWPVPPYLAGAIFTDGHWRLPGRKGAVEFIQRETPEKAAFIARVKRDYETTFGGEMGARTVRSDSVIRGERVQSAALHLYDQRRAPAEALQTLWQELHTRVLASRPHDLLDFLAGVADGDGTFNARVGTRLQIYCGDPWLSRAIVLACLRLGIQPSVAANRGCDNIQIAEGLDLILARTQRIRAKAAPKLNGTKLLAARQILGDRAGEVDRSGRLRPYAEKNLLVDARKLERYLPQLADVELKEKLERVVSSALRNKRAVQTAEPAPARVYNIEVEAHHNYVVMTRQLTPVLVANCHAAIVSRELGVPAVVGTKEATKKLKDGMLITVDGEKGTIVEGGAKTQATQTEKGELHRPMPKVSAFKPLTATQVKVNISMPEAIDRALATEPDGVGLLRIEHIVLGLGKHPLTFIRGGKEQEYVDYLVKSIKVVAEPMYPRSVWVRTLDAPTDEFRAMEGGQDEPHEHNPMLGWRGIRRGIEQPELLRAEFKAIRKLLDDGVTNVGIMLPLVQHPSEIRQAKAIARECGIEPHRDCEFGIMIEIPAAALIIDDLLDEGLDFVSFGTNDLTQYTLAVDRNNENVARLYSEFHPAIGKLIEMSIKACRARGVQTSICGQAGSNPKFVEKLIGWGITSVSANIDALSRVRETIARTEQKMLLDKARGG